MEIQPEQYKTNLAVGLPALNAIGTPSKTLRANKYNRTNEGSKVDQK